MFPYLKSHIYGFRNIKEKNNEKQSNKIGIIFSKRVLHRRVSFVLKGRHPLLQAALYFKNYHN